jgi:putative membrane protein
VADVFFPAEGVAYLGTQGDVWDAQKDMGLAYCGAMLAMLLTFLLKKLLTPKAQPEKVAAVY